MGQKFNLQEKLITEVSNVVEAEHKPQNEALQFKLTLIFTHQRVT